MKTRLVFIQTVVVLSVSVSTVSAQYPDWQHSGSLYILTTPDGANLPESTREENFPLLVRLHRDWFDFGQARSDGSDIRFSTAAGVPLSFHPGKRTSGNPDALGSQGGSQPVAWNGRLQ